MSTFILCDLRIIYAKARFLQTVLYSSQPKHANNKNIDKIVNVAVIGAPNSGKSTIINKIVERKVCAASNKVHTTTNLARAICVQDDTQIIFLDTPGVITEREQRKYNLPQNMIESCYKSLRCADVIGVMHDVSNRWTKDTLHHDMISMLKLVEHIPSFLILNKVDKLKSKKQLLTIIRNLTNGFIAGNHIPGAEKNIDEKGPRRGYSNFSDVFIVSALQGDGVKDIKEYLVSNAKPASLHYSPSEWTDQTPKSLIEQTVRAKFLDFLAQEIPYNLKIQLEYYEQMEEENNIVCSVAVECPSERLATLIAGVRGGRLRQIKDHVKDDLTDLFKKNVIVDIRLRIKNQSE